MSFKRNGDDQVWVLKITLQISIDFALDLVVLEEGRSLHACYTWAWTHLSYSGPLVDLWRK